mgnify:CR=1 FL=1
MVLLLKVTHTRDYLASIFQKSPSSLLPNPNLSSSSPANSPCARWEFPQALQANALEFKMREYFAKLGERYPVRILDPRLRDVVIPEPPSLDKP